MLRQCSCSLKGLLFVHTKTTVAGLNQGRLLETVCLRCTTCIASQNLPSKNMIKSHLALDSMIFRQRLEKAVHAEVMIFGSLGVSAQTKARRRPGFLYRHFMYCWPRLSANFVSRSRLSLRDQVVRLEIPSFSVRNRRLHCAKSRFRKHLPGHCLQPFQITTSVLEQQLSFPVWNSLADHQISPVSRSFFHPSSFSDFR